MKTQKAWAQILIGDGSIAMNSNGIGFLAVRGEYDKWKMSEYAREGRVTNVPVLILIGADSIAEFEEIRDKAQKYENLCAEIEKRVAKLYNAGKDGE